MLSASIKVIWLGVFLLVCLVIIFLDQHCLRVDVLLSVSMCYRLNENTIFHVIHQYLIALLTFLLLISRLNFFDVSWMIDVILVVFRHFWIVSATSSNSKQLFLDSQCFILLSNGLMWIFDFDFHEGFRSSRFDITISTLNAIFLVANLASTRSSIWKIQQWIFLLLFQMAAKNDFSSKTLAFVKSR